MKHQQTLALHLTLLILALFSQASHATTVATSGSFSASQPCPAFQSKRNQTNPDNTHLTTGAHYTILEADKPGEADWYRITIDNATPRERWVEAHCGTVTTNAPRTEERCNQPGLADSYLLALSWQPAFCEEHRSRKECRQQQASFTLHGLWPNRKSCGTQYGYCGEYHKSQGRFCSYKPLPLSARTLKQLAEVMPSSAASGCLERHEWYKHGTCQTTWNAEQYYQRAIQLTREFNQPAISRFMTHNSGKQIRTQQLFSAIDQALGANAHKRIQLGCDHGNLVDLYINLPRQLPANAPLAELIRQAPERFSNRCGERLTIDATGY